VNQSGLSAFNCSPPADLSLRKHLVMMIVVRVGGFDEVGMFACISCSTACLILLCKLLHCTFL
jgi:hypothetical protein